MESRNPEGELPDDRFVSEKLEDEGTAPNPEPTESLKSAKEPTNDEAGEEAMGSSDVEGFLSSMKGYNINSLEDLYKFKEMMIQFENKQMYEK